MYDKRMFKSIQRVDLSDKVKLRMRIDSEGLYELTEDLSDMSRGVKEDSLKILLENRV